MYRNSAEVLGGRRTVFVGGGINDGARIMEWDWFCSSSSSSCNKHNFKRNSVCYNCRAERANSLTVVTVDHTLDSSGRCKVGLARGPRVPVVEYMAKPKGFLQLRADVLVATAPMVHVPKVKKPKVNPGKRFEVFNEPQSDSDDEPDPEPDPEPEPEQLEEWETHEVLPLSMNSSSDDGWHSAYEVPVAPAARIAPVAPAARIAHVAPAARVAPAVRFAALVPRLSENRLRREVRNGDWTCGSCSQYNFAKNQICHRRGCGCRKPNRESTSDADAADAADVEFAVEFGFVDSDWSSGVSSVVSTTVSSSESTSESTTEFTILFGDESSVINADVTVDSTTELGVKSNNCWMTKPINSWNRILVDDEFVPLETPKAKDLSDHHSSYLDSSIYDGYSDFEDDDDFYDEDNVDYSPRHDERY